MPLQMTCIGCTKTDAAPKHRIMVNATHEEVAWHYDCHAIATGCELCQAVVDAYPDKKDAELGQALLDASHVFGQFKTTVSEGA